MSGTNFKIHYKTKTSALFTSVDEIYFTKDKVQWPSSDSNDNWLFVEDIIHLTVDGKPVIVNGIYI